LLTNALKYSPDAALISVTLSERDTGLILDIENSGVHIPPESLPRLFEPFYRVEASRSRETGGSGLGLYLARMILDRHKAVCTVMNTGFGVRVTLNFSYQKNDSLHENYT
ncbi:MAG: sensor histidine kinase, partial [Hungatella sp.]